MTKKQLEHGKILMEILKQGQYGPVDVAHQVMILYAASGGFLDDVETEEIKSFEKQFYHYMDDHFPEIGKEIHRTGDFSAETEALLKKAILEFKKAGFVHG